MSILNKIKRTTYSRQAFSGLVAVSLTLVAAQTAQAQNNFNTSHVSVDLSVLNDNGVEAPPVKGPRVSTLPLAAPTRSGLLLMPRESSPASTFSPLPESVVLVQPDITPQEPSSFTPPPPKAAAPTPPQTAALSEEEPPAAPKVKLIAPAQPVAPKHQMPKAEPVEKEPVGMPKALPKAPDPAKVKQPDMPPAAPKLKKVDMPPPPPAVKKPEVTKEVIAAPKAEAKKAEPQKVAAVTPKAPVEAPKEGVLTLGFEKTSSKLSSAAKSALKPVAGNMKEQTGTRLQILAYAGGDALSPSRARRLSLSRALAVRSYLIDQGVRSTRIDVRALGNKIPSGDPNRVDIKLIAR